MSCSLMIAERVTCCWTARSEVDDDTAIIDNMISIRTIIQMTLSPLKLSTKFQNPAFVADFFAIMVSYFFSKLL